jgi:RNA polymerase sigma factor (TIGR02999 family)
MLRSMPGDVTELLSAIDSGDPKAAEELLPLVYDELRRLAAVKMASERPGQTLQPTALVHEAWLRLAGDQDRKWKDRQHFFRAAAEAMRRILVDRARERSSQKRGSDLRATELSESKLAIPVGDDDEMLAVNDALEGLAQRDPISADLVKLRYFVGLSMTDTANALNLPLRTAERMWAFARTWLRKEIQDGEK